MGRSQGNGGMQGAHPISGSQRVKTRTQSRIVPALEAGTEPVRIVCFGDSITGVYYHTGGRRAYSDMVGIALRQLYPRAQIEMINAGISGNTTEEGLQRIGADVIAQRPHLVTAMFGMNDVVRVSPEAYRRNLGDIAAQCEAAGAEVVVCTPNSVYPEDDSRPMEVLSQYAQIARQVASERGLLLADCWQAYEDLRARDVRTWQLLLSETIHPNMNGHKVFAEEIVQAVTGARVSLAGVPPPIPAIPAALARLAAGSTVRVTAMPPFDDLIGPALKEVYPAAQVDVTPWPVAGQPLAQIEEYARDEIGWQHFQAHPDSLRPDLVLIAVPPDGIPSGETASTAGPDDEERYIRSYSWILNWSLSFGLQEWDCVAALPSVAVPGVTVRQQRREALAREVIRGQDIGFVARRTGDRSPPGEVLARWLAAEKGSMGGGGAGVPD